MRFGQLARALSMDPEDRVTRMLATTIDDVIAGTRARLTKYPEGQPSVAETD
jgi:hypothetical protein